MAALQQFPEGSTRIDTLVEELCARKVVWEVAVFWELLKKRCHEKLALVFQSASAEADVEFCEVLEWASQDAFDEAELDAEEGF